jgi:hypothetical protein
VEEQSRKQEKVGNSGEAGNECTRKEDGRLGLDQGTGMMAANAGEHEATVGSKTMTADVWRPPVRYVR